MHKVVVTAFALAFVLAFLFAEGLSGQEKRIKKSDLPAAVQKTAEEQSKDVTVKGYNKEVENGNVEYEVELMVNGHSKDVNIDPEGNVLEIEEEVSLASLPATVREGLQQQAGQGRIHKVETLTKHGSLVAYEAKVVTASKHSEIQVGPDGKPLDHKE